LAYQPHIDAHEPNLKVLKELWPYLWPPTCWETRLRVLAALVCLFISKIAAIFVPLLYKAAIDGLSIDPGTGVVAAPLGIILAYGSVRASQSFFNELKDFLFTKVTHRAMHHADLKVFQHLHRLGLRFHLSRKTGFLTRALQRGVKSVEVVLRLLTFNIIPTMVEIIFVCVVLFLLFKPIYALASLITLILYIFYTVKITQWRVNFLRQFNRANDEAGNRSIDSLLNYETVKYFNNEAYEAEQLEQHLACAEDRGVRNMQSLSYLNFGQQMIISLGVTFMMIRAALDVQDQLMTLGDFVLVNTYLIQLAAPLGFLGFAYRETKLALVDMEQMFGLLYLDQEIKDVPHAPDLVLQGGHIEFKEVTFSYDPERPILKGLSFEVPSGKTVAIVGPSGSGKSTIARLLFRFYDVTGGMIIIDGQDIAKVTQQSLRSAIGIVPQDTVLFNDSIAYNIAYGRPGASQENIVRVAQLAKIHDFIMSLPQKYETIVGERGLKLSGGEKQRIAIARTLLKAPSIFIFDEATSALDTRTEKSIQESLREVSSHHTTLIIAHRLSTVVHADEILVLEEGRIVERGRHAQLLKQQGIYSSMWLRQQQEKTRDKEIQ